MADIFHYTDLDGHHAIRSQITWRFLASQPPGEHPFGAYFTNLSPGPPNLALRLRIPRLKTEFVFAFEDQGDLEALPGGRGRHVFYSPADYLVERQMQHFEGRTDDDDRGG